ncbi:hypothetical protein SAMN05444173_2467 [Opitutus sp. GAS368]|jgi:hypothetical protein|nr:hypothetical protein SAMN05444173_2467 [Opitutus sp. GAS368]
MFRDPFVQYLVPNTGEANEVTEKPAFLPKTFSDIFWKRIDGAKCECSLRNLSPSGKRFFEIYFVRLIGTPNQHIPS